MEKYLGYTGSQIVWVGEGQPQGSHLIIPPELLNVPDKELLQDYFIRDGKVIKKGHVEIPPKAKVAFVGVWKIPCGISTYSEFLYPEIAKGVSDYKIFAELDPNIPVDLNDPHVSFCWKRGESLDRLCREIDEYKPDVILVQHEYGIFPIARHWLSFVSRMSKYRLFVTLHSVYRHKDKTVCEAVIPNIIVHTEVAKQVLIDDKKMKAPIHVIPHGCHLVTDESKLWNIYHSKHTFMQFGFGFEYKGWEMSIEACKILSDKYPDAFFTGLFSESAHSKHLHDRYYQTLVDLTEKLGIADHVALIRGYQDDSVLDSFFRLNQCAVFPYRENGAHTVFAVTGAARIAMKSNIPVVTSTVPFFYDLKDVCPQISTAAELAAQIEAAWANPGPQLAKQKLFLAANSWANVAKVYLDILFNPVK